MPQRQPHLQRTEPFRIGAVRVEPGALRLTGPDGQVLVEPKVMAVLAALAERPGALWRRDQLFDAIWAGSPSGEDVLTRAVSLLRKALTMIGGDPQRVVTVPTLGYRLEAEVLPEGASDGGGASVPAALDKPSVAVLAFADLSESGDQAYFADGVAEEIINALVRVPGLKIAGRASAFKFRGRDRDLREIGKTLNVGYILDGSVRKHGQRVRITTQLVRLSDGYHQWSETFDGELGNIFDLQDRIAHVVAGELDLLLHPSVDLNRGNRVGSSFEAYDLLLQARAAYRLSPTADTFKHARALLERAVAVDPTFVKAWIEIATLNNFMMGHLGDRSPKALFEDSKAAVARAMAINPTSPSTIIWSANIHYFEGDCLTAFQMAKTALGLEPENSAIVFSVGHYAASFGYSDEARQLLEQALRLDPLDGFAWHTLARVHQNLGDYDAAERAAERAISLGDVLAIEAYAWNACGQGDADKAVERYMDLYERSGRTLDGNDGTRAVWEMLANATFRNDQETAEMMRQFLAVRFAQPGFEPSTSSLLPAAYLGMVEAFLAQWDGSYALKSTLSVSLWSDFAWARAIRTHPAFPAFAEERRLGALWREFGWPEGGAPLAGSDGRNTQFRFQ